jgi:hypothetical protein
MDLLTLAAILDPREYNSFSIGKIYTLVGRFYPVDFTNQNRAQLECQLMHYELDVHNHPVLQNSSSLVDLTHQLVEIGKFTIQWLADYYD